MARLKSVLLMAVLVASTAARHAPPPIAPPVLATPVAPTIKAGVEKWRAGDYAGAVAIWGPFAAAGDADALFNMGQAYKLGRGVTADATTARDYYRKAAIKGHLPAQANLGIALFQAGEKPEAIKWLRTAADRGEARAQYVLGIATFNGDGVPRSQSVGYGYLLRAQTSGLPQAVTALGTIAPGLSPADRAAGETIAASLAAGTGVPPALAAASGPRLIGGTPSARITNLPVITPPPAAATVPVATAGAAAPMTAPPATIVPAARPASTVPRSPGPAVPERPSAVGINSAVVIPPAAKPPTVTVPAAAAVTATLSPTSTSPATSTPNASAAAAKATLPPAPRPALPLPLREPTPAQADAAAAAPSRPTVATVDIPASRPADATRPADPLLPPVRPAKTSVVASKPFETVDAPAKKIDGWRVQLGAFSSRKLADAAWTDVKTVAAPAKPLFAADGPVTKLQMGPFATRDAAKAACTKLTAAGRACFVTQG